MQEEQSSSRKRTIERNGSQAYDRGASVEEMGVMKTSKILGLGLAALLAAGAPNAIAQNSANSQVQSQGNGGESNAPAMAPQGGNGESTLELAPQPGAAHPGAEEIPGGRNFQQGSDTASVNPYTTDQGMRSGGGQRPSHGGKPYLGIVVKYTTKCYQGGEEHGLEVLKVDANSPASAAGLRGESEMQGLAPAMATAAGVLPGLNLMVNRLLEKADSGEGGDLIVAVDDERIHSQTDLDEKMAQLRPGDTMYLTVLRPIGNGQHKTMKIAIRVGQWGHTYANAGAPSAPVPDTE